MLTQWQEGRLKEFCEFYGWPEVDTRVLFEHSREFFEGVWRGMNPKTRKEEETYYNGPWLTLRQMSYDEPVAMPNSIKTFIDKLPLDAVLLDFGCGVGDTLIHAFKKKICSYGIEMPGKLPFLEFRRNKINGWWKLSDTLPEHIKFSNAICASSLDHVPNPIEIAEKVCSMVSGEIFATPCIDETYNRPTHEKYILKQVPAAFNVIKEHNAHI